MSDGEQRGRCRQQLEAWYANNSSSVPRYSWMVADAIDRLAADVAAVRAKVDAVAPEDVKHFVESEKAWVALVTDQRDAAIRKRDEARAEVERLRAEVERLNVELAARQPAGNSPKTSDSSPAAPQPAGHGIWPGLPETQSAGNAAPAAGWLTEEERAVVEDIASMIEQWFKMAWSDIDEKRCAVLRSLLARAGSPPVVEVPELGFLGPMTGREHRIVLGYLDAMNAAGVAWKRKEVPRGQDLK